MNKCTYNARQADPFYQNVVDEITRELGIKSIKVYASDVSYACASFLNDKPVIAYNPTFMINQYYENKWSVYAILAHEVGHHYNHDLYGHLLGRSPKIDKIARQKELNADYIAGWYLRCKGVDMIEAITAYSSIGLQPDDEHPGEDKRINSVMEGWEDSDKYRCEYKPARKIVRTNRTKSNANALGLIALVAIGIIGVAALASKS